MSTIRARTKSTTPLSRALEYRGLLTRVAKRLGLDRTHVGRVARGKRSSEFGCLPGYIGAGHQVQGLGAPRRRTDVNPPLAAL